MLRLGGLLSPWGRGRRPPRFPSPSELAVRRAGPDEVDGLIVGFFTPDALYRSEAQRMRLSAEVLGLAVETMQVTSAGSWVRNAGLKPRVLADFRQRHRGPLLYVDVDAVFHCNPWPDLRGLRDVDIAVFHTAAGSLLSGTILLGDTAETQELLANWLRACEAEPDEWDQRVLSGVLETQSLRVGALPASHCRIFDDKNCGPPGAVVVEHLQASRVHRDAGRIFRSRRVRRRMERIALIERELTNAAELVPR